jgi:transcriptional regulator with XRE-family HTH domain
VRFPDGKRIRLYATVGRTLQSFRIEAGLSLSALSAKSGVHASQLSKVESGEACPLHVLIALADVYDTTLDALVPVQS